MSFEGRTNHVGDLHQKETKAATDVQAWEAAPVVSSWPLMIADLGTRDALAATELFQANATHRIRCAVHAEVRAGRLWRSQTDGSEYLILNVTVLRGRRKLVSMFAFRQTEAQW